MVSKPFFNHCIVCLLAILLINVVSGQTHICPSEAHLHLDESQAKKYHKDIQEVFSKSIKKSTDDLGLITIPVVVHVVHNTAAQNISDAQILSQIDVLNEAFDLEAPWITQFYPQATDVEINFVLANIDPNGNATSGITRTATDVDLFDYDLSQPLDFPLNTYMKLDAQGGKSAWPKEDYLNIWVVNLPYILKGFGTFPESIDDHLDGVVVNYKYFGNIGTGTTYANYAEGKSCVHEVGHWLNLRHVFANNDCAINDGIDDTPAQEEVYFSCAEFIEECDNTLMLENYMQYTYDQCQMVYTEDQSTVMRANFLDGGAREQILESNGYVANGNFSLSGYLWHDTNNNGVLESGEDKQEGVMMELYTCSDVLYSNQQTDAEGYYAFTDVPPGQYYLLVNQSSLPAGKGPDPFWYQKIACATLSEGNYVQDIALLELAEISGMIWEDMNGNGLQDSSEEIIHGVDIYLRKTDGSLVSQSTGDLAGNYEFNEVFPGEYYIQFVLDDTFVNTIPFAGNNTLMDNNVGDFFGDHTTQSFNLGQDENVNDVDAGFYILAELGEMVWHDINADGILESGEPPLENVQIEIYKNENNNWFLHQLVTSSNNTNGNFSSSVPPGTYYLRVSSTPNNFLLSPPNIGTQENNDSDFDLATLQTEQFDIISGQSKMDLGVGLFAAASLSGHIWFDENADGNFDPNEDGIDNILIEIYNDELSFIANATTNLDGYYSFPNLLPDDYFVQMMLTNNYAIIPQPSQEHYFHQTNGPNTSPFYDLPSNSSMLDLNAGLGFGTVALKDLSFHGRIKGQEVFLEWTLPTSGSFDYVEIEKLIDQEWKMIYSSADLSIRTYTDKITDNPVEYYRLKLLDALNHEHYSDVISIDVNQSNLSQLEISNPVHDVLYINTSLKDIDMELTIYNGHLQQIKKEIQDQTQVKQMVVADLPSGIYYLKIATINHQWMKKFIKI